MKTEEYREELFGFFGQYVDFLAHMTKDEEEKLQALTSNSLPRIEHAISTAQANAMQIENYEIRRVRLQEQAGYGGMTFSEILEEAPEEEQQSLELIFRRIQGYVDEIKFHNTKSMRVAKINIREIDPQNASVANEDTAFGSASGIYRRNKEQTRPDQTSLLTAKI